MKHHDEPERRAIHWRAAAGAGIAAGIASTLVQLLVWSAVTDSLPEALFRDSRLAAAIVLGRDVLPPPSSFDLVVMAVASLVHFSLSIAYAAILGFVVHRLAAVAGLLAGVVFGVALYAVNLYGFTALFPWFAQVRTWDTLLAHVVFGAVAAGAYRRLAIGCFFPLRLRVATRERR